MADAGLLRRLPKVELHCHLVGSMRPETCAALARKHGIRLPVDPVDLYRRIDSPALVGPDYQGTAVPLPEAPPIPPARSRSLLDAAQLVFPVLRVGDDFARVAYESLGDAYRTSTVIYRELFFEAGEYMARGISYATVVDGLIDGLRAAEADFGIRCRLIAATDRAAGPSAALAVVEAMTDHPRDEVVGIGLDGSELAAAPELFVDAYRRAAAAGLRRTAHAGEHVPSARNVRVALDVLGCERIDHGYFVLEDEDLVARCRDEATPFTCACTTSRRAWSPWRQASIARMLGEGLRVTLGSDDPAMFPTTLQAEYESAERDLGIGLGQLQAMGLDAVDAAWLADEERQELRATLLAASDTPPD